MQPNASTPRKIVIVRTKKPRGGGHHGGSWKVAYADFVTAMMAFFLVMWIVGMDQDAREAIEGYFSNPIGYKKGYSSGTSPISPGSAPSQFRSGPVFMVVRGREQETLERVGNQIQRRIRSEASLSGLPLDVEIVTTEEGLRIELIEALDGDTFFGLGSPELRPAARTVLRLIGEELSTLRNPLVIEGHTDALLFAGGSYSNWELSTDRANAARRVLQDAGVDPGRFREIRGYGSTYLRVPENPHHPANRRISILLPFTSEKPDAASVDPASRTEAPGRT